MRGRLHPVAGCRVPEASNLDCLGMLSYSPKEVNLSNLFRNNTPDCRVSANLSPACEWSGLNDELEVVPEHPRRHQPFF